MYRLTLISYLILKYKFILNLECIFCQLNDKWITLKYNTCKRSSGLLAYILPRPRDPHTVVVLEEPLSRPLLHKLIQLAEPHRVLQDAGRLVRRPPAAARRSAGGAGGAVFERAVCAHSGPPPAASPPAASHRLLLFTYGQHT